jgi:AMMECR1 domain-containing protein
LLPQVPVEWGWDRETFLAQTCLKAGLPLDAWRQGAELQAFTAEVFGEDSAPFARLPDPSPTPRAT